MKELAGITTNVSEDNGDSLLFTELSEIFVAGGLDYSPEDIMQFYNDNDYEGATRALADRAAMNLSNYEDYEYRIDDLLSEIENSYGR